MRGLLEHFSTCRKLSEMLPERPKTRRKCPNPALQQWDTRDVTFGSRKFPYAPGKYYGLAGRADIGYDPSQEPVRQARRHQLR